MFLTRYGMQRWISKQRSVVIIDNFQSGKRIWGHFSYRIRRDVKRHFCIGPPSTKLHPRLAIWGPFDKHRHASKYVRDVCTAPTVRVGEPYARKTKMYIIVFFRSRHTRRRAISTSTTGKHLTTRTPNMHSSDYEREALWKNK